MLQRVVSYGALPHVPHRLFMAALWRNRAGHYIFVLLFLSFFFLSFSFPRLISAVADWMSIIYFDTWGGLSENLKCRSEMCRTRLAGNAGHKNCKKIAVWALSHNFVGLYLRNEGTYRRSEKKLVKQQYVMQMFPQYGELRPTNG